MKKAIACLLALPLALAACGAQTTQPAPTQAPEVTTKETAESGETTPAGTSQTSPTGWLRHCVLEAGIWELDCDDGYYDVNRVWDESTATNTFTVLKTDPAAAEQKKAAEFQTQGWIDATAHWGDTIEFYLGEESTEDGGIQYSRCIVDASTGGVETQPLEGNFPPTWYDDTAVYSEQRKGMFVTALTRLDRATGEMTEVAMPGQTYLISGSVDGRWLLQRVNSPAQLPEVASMDGTFTSIWQNSEIEYILYDPANGEMEKLYESSTTGDGYDYCGQRDGSLYFIHWQTNGNGDTAPATVDKLENGAMTPVWTLPFSSLSVSTVQQQGELRWVTQLTEKGEAAIKIYDLADGQTYTRAIEWDKVEGWNAGYPEKLLANDKILVSNGTYTDVYGIDRKAYAVMDCAAYLAGSTDYTPIAMYTGD